MPTAAQCCRTVITAIDFGGGADCLCRVATEPQLVMSGIKATHLLALYRSCGGGGAQLTTACEAAGTSAGSPKSFKKKQVEKEVYERREESNEKEVENAKHIDTAGLIEIDNPNLVEPKSIKARDANVDRTADLSWHEREELEQKRTVLHYKRLQEEEKTERATKDLERLTLIWQQKDETTKKLEVEKAGCNSSQLALSVVNECFHNFTSAGSGCCLSILPLVDIENCLCMVADEPDILDAGITSRRLFRLYIRCGGKRRANDNPAQRCDDTSGGYDGPGITPLSPPPPDVTVTDKPEEPIDRSSKDSAIEVSTDIAIWVVLFCLLCAAGGAIYTWRTGKCVRIAEPSTSGPQTGSVIPTHTTSEGGNASHRIASNNTNQRTDRREGDIILDPLADDGRIPQDNTEGALTDIGGLQFAGNDAAEKAKMMLSLKSKQ